jgi:Zn-dependent M28 family amino/carboxypeptidase
MEAYLEEVVEKLAVPGLRNASGERWAEAMELMQDLIRSAGFEPKIQEWEGEGGVIFRNFIVPLPGSHKQKIILGAHYDTFEQTPGADDNGSAVAVALGFLRDHGKRSFPYPIDVVFYACEEPPFFGTQGMGSYVHAAACNPQDIRFMVCLEMVGYFSDKPGSQDFPLRFLRWIYGDTGNFLMGVGNWKSKKTTSPFLHALQSHRPGFYRKFWIPFAFSGMDWSDHRNYWHHGIPAIMMTDTAMFRNGNYHRADDTAQTLNFGHMAHFVNDLYHAFLSLT